MMDIHTLDLDYFKQIAERVKAERALERAEALKRKVEPKPEAQEPEAQEKTNSRIIIPAQIANPQDYVLLEGRTHGPYSYLDLFVSKERSHLNEDWNQAKESVKKENGYMLTIRQFADFLSLLKSGKAFDGRGRKIDSKELERLFLDITEVKSPWRSEWLDAKFGDGEITYNLINEDGSLNELTESFYRGLTQDKTPGIDLESWLKTADYQGLPTSKTKDGELYYWSPVNGRVAGFGAGSDWADLGWGPADRGAGLGVRLARSEAPKPSPKNFARQTP